MVRKRKKFSKAERAHILFINGGKCRWCSSNKNLEIHHIDRNCKNNRYDNLSVLCKKHHKVLERFHAYTLRKKRYVKILRARVDKIENVWMDEFEDLERCEHNINYINKCLREPKMRIRGKRELNHIATMLLSNNTN